MFVKQQRKTSRHRVYPLLPLAVVLAALVSLSFSCTGKTPVYPDHVRQKLAECEKEREAIMGASARGEFETLEQHAAKAQELLTTVRALFDETHAATATDPELLADYANVLGWMGDYDLAAEALRRATTFGPDNAATWLALGRTLSALGGDHAAEAEQALRESLRLDSTSETAANAYLALGRLYRMSGLRDLANESYAKALEVAPDNMRIRAAMVLVKIRGGNLLEASQDLDTIQDVPIEFTSECAEAIRDFEASRRWIPDTPEGHLAYGKLLIRVERLQDAMAPLERSLKLDPQQYVVWNFLGSVCRQLDQRGRAREAFAKSLEINPDQPRTQTALAELETE